MSSSPSWISLNAAINAFEALAAAVRGLRLDDPTGYLAYDRESAVRRIEAVVHDLYRMSEGLPDDIALRAAEAADFVEWELIAHHQLEMSFENTARLIALARTAEDRVKKVVGGHRPPGGTRPP